MHWLLFYTGQVPKYSTAGQLKNFLMAKKKLIVSSNDYTEPVKKDMEKRSTLLAFTFFGCLANMGYSVVFSGIQDILAGTHIPTTTILSVSMVPQFVMEIIAPYFMKRISNLVLVSICFINSFVGFIVVAYVKQVQWKIAGVGLATLGISIGVITVVSLTSYFQPKAMSAYSTGTGIGLLAGALYYTGKNMYT
jgi:hypothetical protein